MKKINDKQLLEMSKEGTPQKEIAEHFNVSEAAVSKRLKRLRSFAARPAILDKLSEKEQRFVAGVVEGKSQTQSAMDAFDVTTRDSAKSLGYRLGKDPEIKLAISEIMKAEGLTRSHLVKKLKGHVDHDDPTISLRAVDIGLRLADAYPIQKQARLNLNFDVCPVDLSAYLNK